MIDDLLDLQVIQPSKATTWSQVHLVCKPGGWRFTVDYRGLNKVILNEGWRIPNMREMVMQIGHKNPKCFVVADLTSGFFQLHLNEDFGYFTPFVSFCGIFEWTWVAIGLPSANYFQKSMVVFVLHDVLYKCCELYIEMLIFGNNDDDFSKFPTLSRIKRHPNLHKLTINRDKVSFMAINSIHKVVICPRNVLMAK